MSVTLSNDWGYLLQDELEQPYYKELRDFLDEQYHRQLFILRLTIYLMRFIIRAMKGRRLLLLDKIHTTGLDRHMGLASRCRRV